MSKRFLSHVTTNTGSTGGRWAGFGMPPHLNTARLRAFTFGGERKQRPSEDATRHVFCTRIGYNSSEKLLCGGWSGSDHLLCKQCKLHVTWLRGQLSAMILASVAAGRITIDALSPSGPPWTAGHWIGPRAKVQTVLFFLMLQYSVSASVCLLNCLSCCLQV